MKYILSILLLTSTVAFSQSKATIKSMVAEKEFTVDLSTGSFTATVPGIYHIVMGSSTNSFIIPAWSGNAVSFSVDMRSNVVSPVSCTGGTVKDKNGTNITVLTKGSYLFKQSPDGAQEY